MTEKIRKRKLKRQMENLALKILVIATTIIAISSIGGMVVYLYLLTKFGLL